ncbi:MAG: ABC transporter ATP-binding protein [Lachnospiraceae bacterium]|nr:ABC transporter ATP-binding protein [Lachnospiraceae bacterium]
MLQLRNIKKTYFINKPNELKALNGIDLDVYEGEYIAIVGESGSGKSTLMNILGLVDSFDGGEFLFDGININEFTDEQLCELRNEKIGFVFQNFNLIPRLTAQRNVELPMLYYGKKRKERKEKAEELLGLVGMEKRVMHYPNQLSGGQKQRVAIARALANEPSIILADEPTGSLDSETSKKIMKIFSKLNKQGKTIIVITHSSEVARCANRVINLKDGKIVK